MLRHPILASHWLAQKNPALPLVEPVRHALVNQFPANSSKAYGFKALAALKGVTLQFRQWLYNNCVEVSGVDDYEGNYY